MKRVVLLLLAAAVFTYCNGQDKNKQGSKKQTSDTTLDPQPQISVKVNRKYDTKGNLVRFDSTYSYSYSSKGLDSTRVSMNQLFRDFKADFPGSWRSGFDDIFFSDSLARYDFLNPDYFSRRFELNMDRMRRHFRQMDSTKTLFLRDARGKKEN